MSNKHASRTNGKAVAQHRMNTLRHPNIYHFSYAAISSLLMATDYANATTLNQAVNDQLATVSVPCERLLGGDSGSVLTGNLASICSRAVPFGVPSQESNISTTNANSLSDQTLSLLKQKQGKKKDQDKPEINIGTKWSFFATAAGGTLNRDVTTEENGFDSHIVNLLAGSTYAVNVKNTLGAAIALQRHTGDYIGGGDFKDNASGIRLLETYHPSEKFFLQAVGGFDSYSSQRTRFTSFDEYINGVLVFSQSGTPNADYSYHQTELSVLGGYNFSHNRFTLTPQLGLTWLVADYGSYKETGSSGLELNIHNDKRKSLQSSLGIQATDTLSTHFAVIIPQIDARWKHEYADKSRQVNISFVEDNRNKMFSYDTQTADRDFFELGAGVSFVYSHGIQSFVRLQTVLGQQAYHSAIATLGLNVEL